MKNLYKLNEFLDVRKEEKLNEADRFSGDVSFSESLIGRLFNNIFSFFRKSIYTGLLIYYKRKLENTYLEGVIKALVKNNVGKAEVEQNSEQAIEEARNKQIQSDEDVDIGVDDEDVKKELTEEEKGEIAIKVKKNAEERKMEVYPYFQKEVKEYNINDATPKNFAKISLISKELKEILDIIESTFRYHVDDDTKIDISNIDLTYNLMKTAIDKDYAKFRNKAYGENTLVRTRNALLESILEWHDVAKLYAQAVKKLKATKSVKVNGNSIDRYSDEAEMSIKAAKKEYMKNIEEFSKAQNEGLKIFEANENLEAEKKRDKTMGQLYPGEDLGDYKDMKMSQLSSDKIKNEFKENPELLNQATESVNVEKIKDIQLSAELLYHRSEKTEDTGNRGFLTKNFRAGEKEKFALETKWKKMIAKVKKQFQGILDTNKLDPILLVNADEAMRKAVLDGKEVPNVYADSQNLVTNYETTQNKNKLGVDDVFPYNDLWWTILVMNDNKKRTYGLLVYKFNVPEINVGKDKQLYLGNHLAFLLKDIYRWGDVIHDVKENNIDNFDNYKATFENDKEIFKMLEFNGKNTPILVKVKPDNKKAPSRTGSQEFEYDIWVIDNKKWIPKKTSPGVKLSSAFFAFHSGPEPLRKYGITDSEKYKKIVDSFNNIIGIKYPKGKNPNYKAKN